MADSYTYIVARIRALESRMLTAAHLNRMIEAQDLEKAFFVLNETAYSEHISASTKPNEYEDVILSEIKFVRKMLGNHAGKDKSLLAIWRKDDFGNMKNLIRASKFKIERGELSDFGTIDKNVLGKYIIEGEGVLPIWAEKALNRAVMAFEESREPSDIDDVLDKTYIQNLANNESPFLKTLARNWETSKHPFDFEGYNKTIAILKNTKRKAFGIDPVISFWLVKQMEAKTIRQVLTGKKHKINTNKMKERELYA